MKKNPGRKERRYEAFHGHPQAMHGKPNTLHFMTKINPQIEPEKTTLLTTKRIEMLKKHPERILESERKILSGQKE